MKRDSHAVERETLLRIFDEAFDRKAWHGPNLRGSIRRVGPEEASWRPKAGRHSIAEIVVHCAYWKYAVQRRILGTKRGSFPLKGSNWFALPADLTAAQWQDYVALLDDAHQSLRETIATAPWADLCAGGSAGAGRGTPRPAGHIYGIALHDTYHAGQIRMLKVLNERSRATETGVTPGNRTHGAVSS